MGLFNSYLKPGPGVEKDAPKKKGLFLYLELFFRKFFKIIQANMLYFILSLPLIILVYIFAPVSQITQAVSSSSIGSEFDAQSLAAFDHTLRCMVCMLVLTFYGSGPASAGLAYIYRCITREEHAWIWSDFFQRFKENLKQSLIVTVASVIMLFLSIVAIYYYYQMYLSTHNMFFAILLYIMGLVFLIFTLMHIHIYQLMVTYECKTKDLYKNALLLTLGKLPLNIILAVISLVIIWTIFNVLEATFCLLLFFLLLYSVVRFPLEFYSARTVNRLIEASSRGDNE